MKAGHWLAKLVTLALFISLTPILGPANVSRAASPDIVISQVYGGGGNSGATLKNDFVELFNRGLSAVDITGWSVQYTSATGTIWQVTTLTGSIQPGQYYLIQEAQGAGGTTNLPTPDAIGAIMMASTSGKVALVNSTTALAGACPSTGIVDLVGFGSTANCSEGSPAPAPSNTTAALRASGGCVDTNNNAADFAAGTPNPRNTSSALNICPDAAPSVVSIVPTTGATGIPLDANITVTFSEPVDVATGWFDIECSVSGSHAAAVSGGSTAFTLDPDANFTSGESCTVTIYAAQVTDQDTVDPPDNMPLDATKTFTPGNVCDFAFTPIYSIQGSGATAAITGAVATKGVVVGDYEGPSPALRGFYIQSQTDDMDPDPLTSEGIFVYNANNNSVSLGDVVRVTGNAEEYQGQTQIGSVTSIVACGIGSVIPTDVTLPFASADFPERYEGMLVRMPQTLYVTEHYQLGRFDQVVMSSEARLQQPTNVVAPGAPALALQASNDLNRIIVDDALNSQDPDPILFGRGGLPLSASNTLRGGDTATGIVGVMTYTWAGNSASPNAYRIRPINAMGGQVLFEPTNARPLTAPAVGGTLRVATMNLLNFFNTFGTSCTLGVGGAATDCRGASNQTELDRQVPKTVAAIVGTGADIVGIGEIENDGYDATSAIQFLVDKLNEATTPGTYAFVDVDARTGQVNALGTDAIKVGLIYKPAVVTPVGQTAALNSTAFVNGGDTSPRNRPALAQTFTQPSTNGRLVVVVNHLKSKGSVCDAPDALDGQGNCNAVRNNAASELAYWLQTDPTGTGETDILITGDLNSYAKEDPVTTLTGAGYTDLLSQFQGASAYSYVFDGQWGYLDHALASASLVTQVTGVAEWHIDADEPSVLDYNAEYKSAGQLVSLYAADEFRIGDHDPTVVGLNLTGTKSFIYLPFSRR